MEISNIIEVQDPTQILELPKSVWIPLNDLRRQYHTLQPILEEAITRVLSSGRYTLGPEVEAFEASFAEYSHCVHCVGVANGTDALEVALRALAIGPGDEVITVANAGMYSTTAIRAVGAKPVFAEIDPSTLLLDHDAAAAALSPATKALIVTHLYGRMAEMTRLLEVTSRAGVVLIEDCAQAHGASQQGRPAGSWGQVGCFSFYPTKNLGALGDAGAIITNDRQIAERARQLRQYGWESKYLATLPGGRNSRLDEIQAVILHAKLPYLDRWNQLRQEIAGQYRSMLPEPHLNLPPLSPEGEMVYHLFVVRTTGREKLLTYLRENGIGCDIHYPVPDYLQPSLAGLGFQPGDFPRTEQAAGEVLSLPMFPELTQYEVCRICDLINDFFDEE